MRNLEICAHAQAKTHPQRIPKKTLHYHVGLVHRLSTDLAKGGKSVLAQS